MSQGAVNSADDAWKAEQQMWNSWSHNAKQWWNNAVVTMIRIDVLVSLVAFILLILPYFGSLRRRRRNCFFQNGALIAYNLSFSLATYVIGSMQSSGLKSSMYPIWAISLFMLHACTDSITAYSLHDNKEGIIFQSQAWMYTAYVGLLVITVLMDYNIPRIYVVLLYMPFIAYFRYAQRLAVCHLAAYSWNLNKTVDDYMYDEQNVTVSDQATMEGCTYLVDWPISKSKFDAPTYATQLTVGDYDGYKVIDIAKIWRCKDKSLLPELKDACLSFSLFHLLRRRFFGFACDESKDRARNFVFNALLLDGDTDYNRVFKVIEVELAYMYDFFFTKYAVIYYGSVAATIWSLISAACISVTVYITVQASPVKISHGDSSIMTNMTVDVWITLVLLSAIALLELLQILFYWAGIWGRVSFVCQSVREQARLNGRVSQITGMRTRGSYYKRIMRFPVSCIVRLKQLLTKIGLVCSENDYYWQHDLGQYSLLDSVSYYNNHPLQVKSCRFKTHVAPLVMKFLQLTEFAFSHPMNAHASMVRDKVGKFVELSDEVKEAVIRSFKYTGGTLSNGRSSLQFNGAHHLLWACEWEIHPDRNWSQRHQNQTHIILTWHIATCYCEMATLYSDGAAEPTVPFSIATRLSKYCAYLVVRVPKLLPGHHYDTRSKFDAAATEAVTFLERATSTYMAMKRLAVPEDTETIFESGVKLGKQLEEMEEATRWLVMADFWAEMILYLAPSDNVEEHIERLAKGGEFITHLWALLSHAGILERDQER